MIRRQRGYVGFGVMTLIVGGLALAGLLFYGWRSGHELPLWPAVAVVLVNAVGAVKLVLDMKKAKNRPAETGEVAKPARSGKGKAAR